MGSFLTDARARTDDDDDLAGELFLRGHTLQFRFFEEPVFDIESFLLGEGDILVNSFGPPHDFHGAVVELGRDPRLRLILTPGNHAQAWDEDHGRIRVAHGGRVRTLAGIVIGRVVLAVLLQGGGELGLQRSSVLGLGIPVHVEWLDLSTKEVVWARGSEFGEPRGVLGVNKAQDFFVVLNRADEALLLGDLAAKPR